MAQSSPAKYQVIKSTTGMKVLGFLLIVAGAIVCVTMLGATIVGIPSIIAVIIVGIPVILAGINCFLDVKFFQGGCPSCGNAVQAEVVRNKVPSCTCSSCKKCLTVQEQTFVVVD